MYNKKKENFGEEVKDEEEQVWFKGKHFNFSFFGFSLITVICITLITALNKKAANT